MSKKDQIIKNTGDIKIHPTPRFNNINNNQKYRYFGKAPFFFCIFCKIWIPVLEVFGNPDITDILYYRYCWILRRYGKHQRTIQNFPKITTRFHKYQNYRILDVLDRFEFCAGVQSGRAIQELFKNIKNIQTIQSIKNTRDLEIQPTPGFNNIKIIKNTGIFETCPIMLILWEFFEFPCGMLSGIPIFVDIYDIFDILASSAGTKNTKGRFNVFPRIRTRVQILIIPIFFYIFKRFNFCAGVQSRRAIQTLSKISGDPTYAGVRFQTL